MSIVGAGRLFVVAVVVTSTVTISATPAGACSCATDAAGLVGYLGEHPPGPSELVFTARAVEEGLSNVTAEWSRPPQPGRAHLVEVDEVFVGDVPERFTLHTPAGEEGEGSCAIELGSLPVLVLASQGDDGYATSSSCGIFELVPSLDLGALAAVLGAPTPPGPASPSVRLDPGVARPPDPEDVVGQEVFEELGGELDLVPGTATTTTPREELPATSAPADARGELDEPDESPDPPLLAIAVAVLAVATVALLGASALRRR